MKHLTTFGFLGINNFVTTGTVVIGYSPFAGYGTTAGNIIVNNFFALGRNLELDTLGSIQGAGDASTDIKVLSLTMNAVNGIGSATTNPLETMITDLTANNTSSGNINIFNTGDLHALSVINSAPGAWVYLGAASNIYVTYISSYNVSLDATTGSIIGQNPTCTFQ